MICSVVTMIYARLLGTPTCFREIISVSGLVVMANRMNDDINSRIRPMLIRANLTPSHFGERIQNSKMGVPSPQNKL